MNLIDFLIKNNLNKINLKMTQSFVVIKIHTLKF